MFEATGNRGRSVHRKAGNARGLCARLPKWLKAWAFLATSSLPLCVPGASAQNTPLPYQTAASILALSPEQAERGDSATLRGVVTGGTDYGLFVQDRTAGIWVDWSSVNRIIPGSARDFNPGDEVEAKGHMGSGLFSPVVSAESVRKLGRTLLPHPKPVTLTQLMTGNEDSQYVTITGVVRSAGLRQNVAPAQRMWLKLATPDGSFFATLPEKDEAAAVKLIDAVVRIDAPATCTKNLHRQLTSVGLAVPDIRNITVVRSPPADLFGVPVMAVGDVMRYRSPNDSGSRVRVTGTVTYSRPGGSLILEEQGSALLVKTVQTSAIQPGDRIEAVGFPTFAPSGPYLEDSIFRHVGRGRLPDPAPVSIDDLSSGRLTYNLVSIEGKLVRRVTEPHGQVLLLQNGATLFRADLEDAASAKALQQLQEGSTVRVSGISVLNVEGSWHAGGPNASAINFTILLRSPRDVQEIVPASWWTTRRLLYVAAILGILVFLFFGAALSARLDHWKLEAVLRERERLAHEIHDTLAQSFAGIGFQLRAVSKAIPDHLPELRKQLDLASALVRHSHKEARRSIEPVQLDAGANLDLAASLEASARRMVEGGSVEVSVVTVGQPAHPLQERVADALLHIGQEAVANAVRHADPSHLTIELFHTQDCIKLSVGDDGCGFIESGDLLGFGLRGMRRRAAAISARLEIVSNPGEGTQVQVVCPVAPGITVTSFLKRSWRVISAYGSHHARNQ